MTVQGLVWGLRCGAGELKGGSVGKGRESDAERQWERWRCRTREEADARTAGCGVMLRTGARE